jgi:S1-C subfamily serine protease
LELGQTAAVEVLSIEPNGPADEAGVDVEDCILAIGEQQVASVDDLHRLLTQLPIDVPATITLLRGERRLERMVLPRDYPHPAPGE